MERQVRRDRKDRQELMVRRVLKERKVHPV
jgi:hypothetical protein